MKVRSQGPMKSQGPILVVEEDVGLRERLYDLLRRHNCSVIAAHSSERAMEILKHERLSLLLVDAALSGMNGWEFAEYVRSFDAHVPIILLDATQKAPPTARTAPIQALLPRDASDQTLMRKIDQCLATPAPTRREQWPGTVLVVDDEPKLRATLQGFLQSHGFSVVTASSGEEAVELCERDLPTVVLLDVKMPGMDGLLTLKKLKALRQAVTVLMITGLEEEELMEEALALGADDYIIKPFNLEYLETALLAKIVAEPAP